MNLTIKIGPEHLHLSDIYHLCVCWFTQGLFNLSFDWAVITSTSLQTPFYSSCNYFAGLICSMWLLVPCLWYFDFWNVCTDSLVILVSLQSTKTDFCLSNSIKALVTMQYQHTCSIRNMKSMTSVQLSNPTLLWTWKSTHLLLNYLKYYHCLRENSARRPPHTCCICPTKQLAGPWRWACFLRRHCMLSELA